MSLRVSALRRACAVSQRTYDEFRRTLRTCGVAQVDAVLPQSAQQLALCPHFTPFEPLFTPYFHFHNHQLTTLGDTLIDDYLTDAILKYATQSRLVLTTNTTKQLNAVFHNHFTMRHFARRLRFQELAIPTCFTDFVEAQTPHARSMQQTLDFLEPQRLAVSRRDVAGTSFDTTPLPCGQSVLGWKMSHFVGALDRVFGVHAVRAVLCYLYRIHDEMEENLLQQATRLLLDLVHEFAATHLAEALLAAQGLPVRFIGKTRIIDDTHINRHTRRHTSKTKGADDEDSRNDDDHGCRANKESDNKNEAESSSSDNKDNAHTDGVSRINESSALPDQIPLLVSGFAYSHASAAPTLDALIAQQRTSRQSPTTSPPTPDSSAHALESSLVGGPGVVNFVQRWHESATAKQQISHTSFGLRDGWLSADEQRQYARGPAQMHRVDFDTVRSFADAYGLSHPCNGAVVGRLKHKKPVRDPLFYDKMSDMRNGVPLHTEKGEPLSAYLDRLFQPHERLFEVTMRVGTDRCTGLKSAADVSTTCSSSSTHANSSGSLPWQHSRISMRNEEEEESETQRESEGGGHLVGRAIARRYSVAREAVCRAYIGGVVSDLQRMMSSPQGDTQNTEYGMQ